MNRFIPVILVVAANCHGQAVITRPTPNEDWQRAVRDIESMPEATRYRYRYLSMIGVPPDKRLAFLKALNFHANSLSRIKNQYEFPSPVVVSESLLRIDYVEYGWDYSVWEKFAALDPYYHEKDFFKSTKVGEKAEAADAKPETKRVAFTEKVPYTAIEYRVAPNGRTYGYQVTKYKDVTKYREETVKAEVADKGKGKSHVAHNRYLDAQAVEALTEHTKSEAPLVRADWFLWQAGAQLNRGGAGYYDFLGIKDRAAFEKLVGLDRKLAESYGREIGALVGISGVSNFGRQIHAWETILGRTWFTLDLAEEPTGEKNPIRQLEETEFKHDGEEAYGFLPNGLLAVWAGDDEGNNVDVVPATIATEDVKTGRDGQIHIFVSCVRCHEDGLKSISDYARSVFSEPLALTLNDLKNKGEDRKTYEKYLRLKRLYTTDLVEKIEEDRAQYAKALLKVNGLTPKANAEAYHAFFSEYIAEPVTVEKAAVEMGVVTADLKKAIGVYADPRNGGSDTVLAAFIAKNPQPIRREHWEEAFLLAQTYYYRWETKVRGK